MAITSAAMDDASLAKRSDLGRQHTAGELDATRKARLQAAMPGLKERAKTLVELAQSAEFLYTDGPRTLDEAARRLLTARRARSLSRS